MGYQRNSLGNLLTPGGMHSIKQSSYLLFDVVLQSPSVDYPRSPI
jgi:hypothetical protein